MTAKRKTTPKKTTGRMRAHWEELDPVVTGAPVGEANSLRNELKMLCAHLCNYHGYDPRTLKFQIDKYPEREPETPEPVDTSFLDGAKGLNQ